jgi:hypothetical protein
MKRYYRDDMPDYGPALFRASLFIGLGSIILCCAASGNWQRIAAVAPLAILLVPGYLELLPRGGNPHPNSCDCAKFDAKCEWGFYCAYAQKGFLILPVPIFSIFLDGYFNRGFTTAVAETSFVTLSTMAFSLVVGLGFYALSRKNER